MTTPSAKPEFPPLLEVGRHQLPLSQLRKVCVDAFPYSTTRKGIMDGVDIVVARLLQEGVKGELWVDGGFLTLKMDPEDADMVLCVNGDFYDSCSPDQRAVIDWVEEQFKINYPVRLVHVLHVSRITQALLAWRIA
jgi:hypothetical protein